MRMLGHNFGSDWGAGEGARKSQVIRAMATADADAARDRSGLRAATRTPPINDARSTTGRGNTVWRTLKAASALGRSLVLVNTVTAKNLQNSDNSEG